MRWHRKARNQRSRLLQERCEELVRALGLPHGKTLTVHAVCDHLRELHNRPIHLVPLPLPTGSPDGLLVSAEGKDLIVYEQRLAPVHQRQVILHEIGHYVCEHRATPIAFEVSRLLLPSLDPNLIHRVLGRDHSHADDEDEAEYVASILGRQISAWASQQTLEVPPESKALAQRLSVLERRSQPW
ncbi:ImmA/IrrE family metallo-endopeptidase [Streptomyces sp. NPDC059455]|uniref:ImmA/IrrE family metallo-endopeptidase n=1 Tax=Streptomyces sp. NPDC059455 TaxID=3346837 RepID=UPI0036ACAA07